LTSVGGNGEALDDKAAQKAARKALKAEQKAQKRAEKAERKAQKQADKDERKLQKQFGKTEQKEQKAIRKAMKMMLLGAKRRVYPSVISHRPGLRSPMRPPL